MPEVQKSLSSKILQGITALFLAAASGCTGVVTPMPKASQVPTLTAATSPAAAGTPTRLPSPTATFTLPPTSTALPSPFATDTLVPSPTASVETASVETATIETSTPAPEPSAERIPILEYHYSNFRLSDQVMMTAEWFNRQVQWLSDQGFTTLNAADLVDFLNGKEFPVKSAVLSFDIGVARRADFEKVIIPALKEHHFTAIFFVLVNDTVITDSCGHDDRYCWDELRQWQSDGTVSVESHGLYHPDYATLNPADIQWDAGQSRKIIQDKMGIAPLGFAYPSDSVSDQAVKVVQTLGYDFAVSGFSRHDRSVHPRDADRFNLPRVYPYSNLAIYPVISGANGATFDQLMTSSIAPEAPAAGTASAVTTPAPQDDSLLGFCRRNPPTDSAEWIRLLDSQAFAAQVSQAAQGQLPMGIVVRPSCNILAGNTPRAIVLHNTDGSLEGAVATFQSPNNTSVHYIIGRDGSVVQMVQESMVAFHVSCYGYRSYCVPTCPICAVNGKFVEPYTQSIGIELVNNGHVDPASFHGNIYEDYENSFGYRYWEDYPAAQIAALKILVEDIRARWSIPWELVIGHSRVNNKPDPGPALNLFWPRYGFPPRPPIFDNTQP